MANHTFRQPLGSIEVDMVSLYGALTIGASGAITASSGKGWTAARTSTGKYTITLDGSYSAFMWGDAKIMNSALSDPTTVGIYANTFSEAVSSTTPTVVFQFVALDDGAAADPASGATVHFKIDVRNSSVS